MLTTFKQFQSKMINTHQKFVCDDEFILNRLSEVIAKKGINTIEELENVVKKYNLFDEVLSEYKELLEWLTNCDSALFYTEKIFSEYCGIRLDLILVLKLASDEYCRERAIELVSQLKKFMKEG